MFKFTLLIFLFAILAVSHCRADRILIFDSGNFTQAGPELITALEELGHIVGITEPPIDILPPNFVSRCINPKWGWDWVCFFGNYNYSSEILLPLKNYIDSGGKVFYIYDVECCITAAESICEMLTTYTGLTITPNENVHVATTTEDEVLAGLTGWVSTNINCCIDLIGNAYRGLDGVPFDHQFISLMNLNDSSPSIDVCNNFGCYFATTDFLGGANKGGFVSIGDVNVFYDGTAPTWTGGGVNPINYDVVNFFFPNNESECYLFPPGCLTEYHHPSLEIDFGPDSIACVGDEVILNAITASSTYVWQDGSTSQTYTVNEAGEYWVEVESDCLTSRDSIFVGFEQVIPLDLGSDTAFCELQPIVLDATIENGSYLWQNGSPEATFIPNQSGLYWVDVAVGECTNSDTIYLVEKYAPAYSIGNDTIICPGTEVALHINSEGEYSWQDLSSDSIYHAQEPGIYYVDVTNECGTARDSVEIGKCPCAISIPECITVGYDCNGVNIQPQSTCELSRYHYSIYDDIGRLVFSNDQLNLQWNGVCSLANGIYRYSLEYQFLESGTGGGLVGCILVTR